MNSLFFIWAGSIHLNSVWMAFLLAMFKAKPERRWKVDYGVFHIGSETGNAVSMAFPIAIAFSQG